MPDNSCQEQVIHSLWIQLSTSEVLLIWGKVYEIQHKPLICQSVEKLIIFNFVYVLVMVCMHGQQTSKKGGRKMARKESFDDELDDDVEESKTATSSLSVGASDREEIGEKVILFLHGTVLSLVEGQVRSVFQVFILWAARQLMPACHGFG